MINSHSPLAELSHSQSDCCCVVIVAPVQSFRQACASRLTSACRTKETHVSYLNGEKSAVPHHSDVIAKGSAQVCPSV